MVFLSVASGNEITIKMLEEFQKVNSFNSTEWVKRGKERTQEWVKKHLFLFFIPD